MFARPSIYRLNGILKPHGVEVKCEALAGSERQVKTVFTRDTTADRH
jgi:hypothetical protein